MPDIDIDVPWFKHKETFQKIYKKWGDKNRIFNHNMYSHKSLLDKQFETKDIVNLSLKISS